MKIKFYFQIIYKIYIIIPIKKKQIKNKCNENDINDYYHQNKLFN